MEHFDINDKTPLFRKQKIDKWSFFCILEADKGNSSCAILIKRLTFVFPLLQFGDVLRDECIQPVGRVPEDRDPVLVDPDSNVRLVELVRMFPH